jgi:hypothetical protein
VTAFDKVSGGEYTALAGNVTVWGLKGVDDVKVIADKDASVSSGGSVKVDVTTENGAAAVAADKDVLEGTVVTAKKNHAAVRAGGSVHANVIAYDRSDPNSGQSASIVALGNVQGKLVAQTYGTIASLGDISAYSEVFQGPLELYAGGTLTGEHNALDYLSARAFSVATDTAAVQGSYTTKSKFGNVEITSAAGLDAIIKSAGSVSVVAHQDVSGSVAAGSNALVTAGENVNASVVGNQQVIVSAIKGDVSNTIESKGSDVDVTAAKDVKSAVTAKMRVTVIAGGDVQGAVTSSEDNADVFSLGSILGDVSGKYGVALTALGDVSSTVTADSSIGVTARGSLSGSATASSVFLLTLQDSSMDVTTGFAKVMALGDVSGTIAASTGSVSVTAGGSIAAQLTAGSDIYATAGEHLSGTVTSGNDVRISSWDGLNAVTNADQDVSIWSAGPVESNVTAGRNLSLVSIGSTSGNLTAVGLSPDPDPEDGTGNIRHVRAWGTISGNLLADQHIGDVYTGAEFQGTLAAEEIGVLEEYHRAQFVALPREPIALVGEFVADSNEAYAALERLAAGLAAAKVELQARAAAALGSVNLALAALMDAVAEAGTRDLAVIANIRTRADKVLNWTTLLVQQGIADATIQQDAAEAEATYWSTVQTEIITRGREEAEAMNVGIGKMIDVRKEFMAYAAGLIDEIQTLRYEAAMVQQNMLIDNREALFAGTFIHQVDEYVLDKIQNAISAVEVATGFMGPYGLLASVALGVGNSLIDAARGHYVMAGIGIFLSIIPLRGALAKGVGDEIADVGMRVIGREAGEQAGRITSNFLRHSPNTSRAAAGALECAAAAGCFAGDTEVLVIQPYDTSWLATAGGIFALLPAGAALAYRQRRKKRQGEAELDTVLSEDAFDFTAPGDQDDDGFGFAGESGQFDELCDRLFHDSTDGEDDFWC